ncbi:MAG: branched-chain amino acid ABC transporter permease [Thermodesulfobacteriota bacterium]|nr:branched-chain amino acid ABC transporter permease [Thermodesulfobacteriota bacterium]
MGKKNLFGVLALSLFILIFPLISYTSFSYYLDIMVFVGLIGMITMGLSLLMGYAGQISLGHAAFYGLGAYTSGIMTVKLGLNPWLALLAGAALSAAVAVVVGAPSLKLRGHYLAMATLGFGQIIFIIFNEWISLTEGPDGFGGIPRLSAFGFTFDTSLSYFYLVWTVAILMLIFILNVIHSRNGRALMSIHGSEVAAMAMGVNAAKLKIQVFVISAVMASVAGSLYAHYVRFINPPVFDLFFSIKLLMMVVIGGMTNVWGALLGAVLITFLPEWLIFLEDFDVLAYGLILVLIVMFLRKGLVSLPGVLYRLAAHRPRGKS